MGKISVAVIDASALCPQSRPRPCSPCTCPGSAGSQEPLGSAVHLHQNWGTLTPGDSLPSLSIQAHYEPALCLLSQFKENTYTRKLKRQIIKKKQHSIQLLTLPFPQCNCCTRYPTCHCGGSEWTSKRTQVWGKAWGRSTWQPIQERKEERERMGKEKKRQC